MARTVELRCAPLPYIGAIAEHYWLVVRDEASGACNRWEVWQTADAGGRSYRHVHCDLKHADAGVGGGPMRVIATWDGFAAQRIHDVLCDIEKTYPHAHRYRPWPGPNSNTFVAWVLRQAGIGLRLPWKAIGKDY